MFFIIIVKYSLDGKKNRLFVFKYYMYRIWYISFEFKFFIEVLVVGVDFSWVFDICYDWLWVNVNIVSF